MNGWMGESVGIRCVNEWVDGLMVEDGWKERCICDMHGCLDRWIGG